MSSADSLNNVHIGLVTAVKGSVVEVYFTDDLLLIYSVLHNT
jgi:hypothetical protein